MKFILAAVVCLSLLFADTGVSHKEKMCYSTFQMFLKIQKDMLLEESLHHTVDIINLLEAMKGLVKSQYYYCALDAGEINNLDTLYESLDDLETIEKQQLEQ